MRSDVTPDMNAKRRAAWLRVEREFGEPFWDVVQGFADMGYGKYATARALDLDPSAFSRATRTVGQHIVWPAYRDQVVWQEHSVWDDERRRLTSEGRRRSGKGVLWVEVNGERMLASDAAKIAGVTVSTICRRWKNGARGSALIAPAMSPRERGYRSQVLRPTRNRRDHAWRASA